MEKTGTRFIRGCVPVSFAPGPGGKGVKATFKYALQPFPLIHFGGLVQKGSLLPAGEVTFMKLIGCPQEAVYPALSGSGNGGQRVFGTPPFHRTQVFGITSFHGYP